MPPFQRQSLQPFIVKVVVEAHDGNIPLLECGVCGLQDLEEYIARLPQQVAGDGFESLECE